MSYTQAKINLLINGWEQDISHFGNYFHHNKFGRLLYRHDIKHFEAISTTSIPAVTQSNKILKGKTTV